MKKLHRGPTILLTLVPALAGGLAIGLILNAAKEASQYKLTEEDKQYLATINGILEEYEKTTGKTYGIPHKIIMSLKDKGYNVLTHKLSNANFEFVYDASVNRFIIMYGDRILATPDGYSMTNTQMVFKFTSKYDKDSKYGQYLLDDYEWDDPTVKFEIKASIDVGNNTNIKYMEYKPDNSNTTNTRMLRTYCELLNVNENSDVIYHCGESNNINVYGASESNPCNYIEVGGTAYLYVKNTKLSVGITNLVDAAQIDVLETDTGVTAGSAFRTALVTMLIGNDIPGVMTATAITYVENYSQFADAISKSKPFIRIQRGYDITIGSEIASTISIADKRYILDLNGQNIIDNSGIADGSPLINITATSGVSELILIDCYREGEIQLNKSHYINIEGNVSGGKKTATLYLEGVDISYTSNETGQVSNRNGAIELGTKNKTSSGQYYSRVYMYGGVISANTGSLTHDIEVAGIYANNDALIQIYYGKIESSVNCVRTNGTYPNSIINIVDGTFKAVSSVGECVYLPTGKLNISGGTLEGNNCIAMRGGDVNISGGYLHATGANNDYTSEGESSGSGMSSDGSVICVKMYQSAGVNAYGYSLKISISNATLKSDNSYILQVYRNDPGTGTPTVINQYLDVNFIDGIYYYDHDSTNPVSDYNGVRISSLVGTDFYKINQNGGSWVKTGNN